MKAIHCFGLALLLLLGRNGYSQPTILSQPTDQHAEIGGTAVFNIGVSRAGHISYQWRFNGTELVDGTNSSLALNDLQLNQAGRYDVVVGDDSGSVTSQTARLYLYATLNPCEGEKTGPLSCPMAYVDLEHGGSKRLWWANAHPSWSF